MTAVPDQAMHSMTSRAPDCEQSQTPAPSPLRQRSVACSALAGAAAMSDAPTSMPERGAYAPAGAGVCSPSQFWLLLEHHWPAQALPNARGGDFSPLPSTAKRHDTDGRSKATGVPVPPSLSHVAAPLSFVLATAICRRFPTLLLAVRTSNAGRPAELYATASTPKGQRACPGEGNIAESRRWQA